VPKNRTEWLTRRDEGDFLMMGTKKGMRYWTLRSLAREDPFTAMFPVGMDPVENMQGG